jgi:hypothetical protein
MGGGAAINVTPTDVIITLYGKGITCSIITAIPLQNQSNKGSLLNFKDFWRLDGTGGHLVLFTVNYLRRDML